MSMLSVPGAARWTVRLTGRHKVISTAVVLFIAMVIAVSVTTGPGGAASYRAAPAFTLRALGEPGRRVSLSQYAGQPVIVNFWASWGQPGQPEDPLLARRHPRPVPVLLLGLARNGTP